jgi:Zn-finger domain-containing protein
VEKVKAKSPPAAYRLSARKSSGELSDSQDSDSADTRPPSGNKAKLEANVDITSTRFVRKPFKGYEYRG